MKTDEAWFLAECRPAGSEWPRDLINEPGFPIHVKRAWYLLSKWADKGWYDYGVSLDLGWMEG